MLLRALAASLALAAPAAAQAELPQPVRAIIDAAIAKGDSGVVETVIALARETHPDAGAELDAIQATFQAEQRRVAAHQAAEKENAIRSADLFDNWRGEGQLGFAHTSGNTDSIGLSAGLGLERVGIDWRHKLALLADYQRSNGRTSREQFRFAYEPNFTLDDGMFIYGLGQIERDRLQGYTERFSLSGGLGYRVLEGDGMLLAVKAGPAWRLTEFVNGSEEEMLSGLAAVDFDWQLSERVKLTQDASAFVQSANSSFVATTGLQAGLGGELSAKLGYTVEYDTDPPTGSVQTDTLTRFTLVYGF